MRGIQDNTYLYAFQEKCLCAECEMKTMTPTPSNFTYPLLSKKRLLPCLATVRIVRKVDCGTYWVIDKSVSLLLNKIVHPFSELLPDIEVGKSIACIASIVRPDRDCARPQFCRAVASNFNKCDGSCTVFLIDFGETLTANVYSLYSLNGQPRIVFEAPGAAFLCVVKQRSQSYQRYAKLARDETYVIEIFTVDENEKFSALLYNIPPSEILNDLSENEQCEETKLRGSMLSQWTKPNVESNKKFFNYIESCAGQEKICKQDEKPSCFKEEKNPNRLNEKIRIALAIAKLETKIDVQHAELSRKLDNLISLKLMRKAMASQTLSDGNEPLQFFQYRNLNHCDNYYCKQNRCGFRKHSNRGTRSRNYSGYHRNFQSCGSFKGTPPKFSKNFRKTNEASTQTCLEHLGSCTSRHSLATTTCSSAYEVEMEDSSQYASDTYSLASPNKAAEKEMDGEQASLSAFPAETCADVCSAGTRCWICGKSGSLTRYCVAEPSVFSCLCGNVVDGVSSSLVELSTARRKRVKKEILYTSDESSSEESEEDSICETSCCGFGRGKFT